MLGTTGMSRSKVPTGFNLSSQSSVQLKVVFTQNNEDWPMNYRSQKKGQMFIRYNNQDVQKILFDGLLLRPNISLNTSGYEFDLGENLIDFGTIHVRNHKTLTFHIINNSKVPAKWKIQVVKFPKMKSQGLRTQTNLEKEDGLKVEDYDVFDFNVTEGEISGPSVPL